MSSKYGANPPELILNLPATPQRQTKTTCFDYAHYDAVPGTPGADDNATGVAVLLELARKFAVEPTTRYPVRAFDMEEYGLLVVPNMQPSYGNNSSRYA